MAQHFTMVSSAFIDADDTTCHFLKLPPELRIEVYQYAFKAFRIKPKQPQPPPLLTVCKLTRRECWPIYLGRIKRCRDHASTNYKISSALIARARQSPISPQLQNIYIIIQMALNDGKMAFEEAFIVEVKRLLLGPEVGDGHALEEKLIRWR